MEAFCPRIEGDAVIQTLVLGAKSANEPQQNFVEHCFFLNLNPTKSMR